MLQSATEFANKSSHELTKIENLGIFGGQLYFYIPNAAVLSLTFWPEESCLNVTQEGHSNLLEPENKDSRRILRGSFSDSSICDAFRNQLT